MSEMIERVADAMENATVGYNIQFVRLDELGRQYALDDSDRKGTMLFPSHDAALKYIEAKNRRLAARAALKEIRIPTAAMMAAGSAAGRAHTTYVDNQSARIIFEAMIDAALEEKP